MGEERDLPRIDAGLVEDVEDALLVVGGVVSTLAVRTVWRPVAPSVSK